MILWFNFIYLLDRGEWMANVFEKLITQRLRLNMSLDELSLKTKLPLTHLKALEDGDLSIFSHDLSMVKFYLLSYCDALNLDYHEIEADFDEIINGYSQTLMLKKQREKADSFNNVMKRVSHHKRKITYQSRDYTVTNNYRSKIVLIVLLSLLILIIMFLLFWKVLPVWSVNDNNSLPEVIEDYKNSPSDNVISDSGINKDLIKSEVNQIQLFDLVENNLNNYDLIFDIGNKYNLKLSAKENLKFSLTDSNSEELVGLVNLASGDNKIYEVDVTTENKTLILSVMDSNKYDLLLNNVGIDIDFKKLSSKQHFVILNFKVRNRNEHSK